MSLLITGAGLIGSQIARLEQEAGREPVILDHNPHRDALGDFIDLDRCVIIPGDVTNALDIVQAIKEHGITRIIHTAAYPMLTAGTNKAPLDSNLVGFMGTANVLEAARLFNIERVVSCSSSAVYASSVGGDDNGTYGKEEWYPRHNSLYAAQKWATESMSLAYRTTFGLDTACVRYAGVFGPWRYGGGGIATLAMERAMRAAIKGEKVEIDPISGDWLYSKDAARGTHLLCYAENLDTYVFNFGMGRHYSVDGISEAIKAVVPGAEVTETAQPSRIAPPADLPIMTLDRSREQLGWEPQFQMKEALEDYKAWIERTDTKPSWEY